MHPVAALRYLGGVASRAEVLALSERSEVDRLLGTGDLVRTVRGRYSLPVTDHAVRAAHDLTGVLSHTSAALWWGWAVATVPHAPHVTVRRRRHLSREQRSAVLAHHVDLEPDEVHAGVVTSRNRTLRDCLRSLPFAAALAVADSALRQGDVTGAELRHLAGCVTGPGAAQARRVAATADGRAANPFESVLRAIALEVPGLHLVPQVPVRDRDFFARPDLADLDLGIVVEADSHAWHSSPDALRRDCRRYTGLTVRGFLVLRFSYDDVMHRPEYVCAALVRAVALVAGQAQPGRRGRRRPSVTVVPV